MLGGESHRGGARRAGGRRQLVGSDALLDLLGARRSAPSVYGLSHI